MPVSPDDAALVLAARDGDGAAFGQLFERWSDRCFDVARRIVHDDGRAAEVTQDVFLVAWQQLGSLRDPAAFGGWVLRASRNKALNRLEKEGRSTVVAGDAPLLLDRTDGSTAAVDAEAAMTADELQDLVAAASAVLGERDASVLDLHLRHGFGAPEIAAELDVTTNNAHQLLFRMKKNLAAGVRAWVLVKGGRPSCEPLRVALTAAGIERFGKDAAKVIGRHVDDCDACTRRQAAVLDPASLFAAAPLLVMAPAVRGAVADGLRSQGVPVDAHPEASAPPPDGSPPGSGDPPDGVPADPDPIEEPPATGRRRRAAALAIVLAVIALVVGIAVVASDGEEDLTTTGTSVPEASTTAAPDATTSEADGTTTSTTKVLPAPTAPTTTAGTLVARPHTTEPKSGTSVPVPSTFAPNPMTPTTAPPSVTTTTAPPAPIVDSFTAQPLGEGGSCTVAQWGTRLTWTTTHATAVTITATTVTTLSNQPADGSRVVCRPTPGNPPGGWHLTATGPGGSDSASA